MTTNRQPSRLFRDALPGDSAAVRAILHQSNLSITTPTARERTTHSVIGEMSTFVCEQNGEVVGVLQWRNLGEELEILDLAVAKRHRRSGLASFMLKNFLRHAAGQKTHDIFLEVRESNTPALALYKKFGFSQTGIRPSYYRNPVEAALLMRLKLTG